jgi:hypothetical protein
VSSAEEGQPLQEKLEKAEHRLGAALGEVCDGGALTGGVRKPDTGELIRIDETLALASEAAKQALALRRRLRADARKTEAGSKSKKGQSGDQPPTERPG